MQHLIIAVFALVLLSLALVAVHDTISAGGRIKAEADRRIMRDMSDLAKGLDAFLVAARDPASGVPQLGPAGTDITQLIAPEFLFVPRALQGATWTAGVGDNNPMMCGDMPTVWVCLQPPRSGWRPGVREALTTISAMRVGHGMSSFAANCPTAQLVPGPDPEPEPPPGPGPEPILGAGASNVPNQVEGGELPSHFIYSVPLNQPGGGKPIMIATPPQSMQAVVVDHLRPARVTYSVVASLFPRFNQGPVFAGAFLEIREPSGTWEIADEWRAQYEVNYKRTIEMTVQGSVADESGPASVHELILDARSDFRQTGTIEAVVPPGWEIRYRTNATSGSGATITMNGAQIERYMGQVNPINLNTLPLQPRF